jgi:hypothetical protein
MLRCTVKAGDRQSDCRGFSRSFAAGYGGNQDHQVASHITILCARPRVIALNQVH